MKVVVTVTCYENKRSDKVSGGKLRVKTVGGLRVAVANVRDLLSSTKFEELENMAEQEKLDIIAITESWSNSQIGNSELALKGYAVFRKDRESGVKPRGGGVLLYIKESLIATELVEWRRKECEAVWVGVKDDKGVEICIGVCYRSPNAGDVENRVLMDVINRLAMGRLLLLMGDFNYPMID